MLGAVLNRVAVKWLFAMLGVVSESALFTVQDAGRESTLVFSPGG